MERKGFTLTELFSVIAVGTFVAGVMGSGLNRSRETATRLVCEMNLKGLGAAMQVYSADNGGYFPRAGGPRGKWTTNFKVPDWQAPNEDYAFEIVRDSSGEVTTPGRATISSSLFYLIKYAKVTPKSFVCKGDEGSRLFNFGDLIKLGLVNPVWQITQIWDFYSGEDPAMLLPSQYCSYAYAMPYRAAGNTYSNVSYNVTDMAHPATPVAADRNPHMDKNAIGSGVGDNSAAHLRKGQNVLYKNLSVVFEKNPRVGIAGDNIYTYGGDPNGTKPTTNGVGYPVGPNDAFLVNNRNWR